MQVLESYPVLELELPWPFPLQQLVNIELPILPVCTNLWMMNRAHGLVFNFFIDVKTILLVKNGQKHRFFWIFPVSILLVALMFGILSSGLLSSKFGYKICLIIGCLVQAFGWIMLYFAPSFTILLIGRLVAGLGSGLCTPASYVYVSDIALIRFRGLK